MKLIVVKVFKDVINNILQKTLFIKYKDRKGIERSIQLIINPTGASIIDPGGEHPISPFGDEFEDAQNALDTIENMIFRLDGLDR